MEGTREHCERALRDFRDLSRYLRNRNKNMERINIRYKET